MGKQTSSSQPDLFHADSSEPNPSLPDNANSPQVIEIDDGELYYYPHWLTTTEADQYYEQLHEQVKWQQTRISMFGKIIPIPRLNAWYGDPNSTYTYSGARFAPLPWLPVMSTLRKRLHSMGYAFNSVLANLYRDGQDSVAWHSDDEPELGTNPVVASISLGQTRRFMLRHRKRELATITLNPTHGSLLIMAGETQHHWHHQVPKTRKPVDGRINLTFRQVI